MYFYFYFFDPLVAFNISYLSTLYFNLKMFVKYLDIIRNLFLKSVCTFHKKKKKKTVTIQTKI